LTANLRHFVTILDIPGTHSDGRINNVETVVGISPCLLLAAWLRFFGRLRRKQLANLH
jgi:hypothetical protein